MSKKGKIFKSTYILTIVILCFISCDITKPANIRDGHVFEVSNSKEWNKAIKDISRSGDNKSYAINIIDDIVINAQDWSAFTFGNNLNITVKITTFTEHTIQKTYGGPLVNINENQKVILENISIIGLRSSASLFRVSGILEMINGSITNS